MSTKHIYPHTHPSLIIPALRSLCLSNPHLRLHTPSKTLLLSNPSPNVVPILCGGGSGHEPFAAGYVAPGLLAGAVSGEVFASPSARQVYDAIRLLEAQHPGRGVLVLHNNYTGDCLHFGIGAEQARVAGVQVETVVESDDVSVPRSRSAKVGRRGLAGIVLTCKILGAASSAGLDLKELKALGEEVNRQTATIGTGLDHAHLPHTPAHAWEPLGGDDLELGMGMHNEPGVRLVKGGMGAEELVREMLSLLLGKDEDRSFVRWEEGDLQPGSSGSAAGEGPVLLVNNLGGISTLELSAFAHSVLQQLQADYSLKPARVYVGAYLTSLNSPGFSVTLLNSAAVHRALPEGLRGKVNVLELLDAAVDCPAWAGATTWSSSPAASSSVPGVQTAGEASQPADEEPELLDPGPPLPPTFEAQLRKACEAVLAAEPDLTAWDTLAGDGDCGATFARGAQALLDTLLPSSSSSSSSAGIPEGAATAAARAAKALETTMGGTSGAVLALYLTALSTALSDPNLPPHLAPKAALDALYRYTPARPGQKTLIDALSPFSLSLAAGASLSEAAQKAVDGAQGTRGMQARVGRATYVPRAGEGVVDPGAWGVAVALRGWAEGAGQ